MTQRLANRRILLTGVSRGVGLETARVLLREGADVLGVARDAARLEQAGRELTELAPGRFEGLCVELGAPGFDERVAAAVQQRWGALDVLLNNAGVMLSHEPGILGEAPDVVRQTMEVNLFAPLTLARTLLPLLEAGNEPRIASYRLSKWSLNGLTMLQAAELKGRVSVNALDPGWVRTDLGGPKAPGHPSESAQAALRALLVPFEVTGKLFKDGDVIPY